jgi:hypothetical protein
MTTRKRRRWSQRVTRTSNALDLDPGVFAREDPRSIARSLKRSADRSRRRKADPRGEAAVQAPAGAAGVREGRAPCPVRTAEALRASVIRRRGGRSRNIKTLANFDPPATTDEVRASALQFVRKLSGTTRPSRANEAAFNRAVDEIAAAAQRLLDSLEIKAPPRNREEEARKARERAQRRFA